MWHVGRRPPGRVEKYFLAGDPGYGKDIGRYTQGSEGKQEVDRETGLGWGRRREGKSLSRPVGLGRAGCEGEGGIESRDQGGGSGRS